MREIASCIKQLITSPVRQSPRIRRPGRASLPVLNQHKQMFCRLLYRSPRLQHSVHRRPSACAILRTALLRAAGESAGHCPPVNRTNKYFFKDRGNLRKYVFCGQGISLGHVGKYKGNYVRVTRRFAHFSFSYAHKAIAFFW